MLVIEVGQATTAPQYLVMTLVEHGAAELGQATIGLVRLGGGKPGELLVEGLETAEFYGGLTQFLAHAETWHPAPVIDALFRGASHREGEIAVHFAAMLMYLHGKADEAFDWAHRPFFLRFHTEDPAEREAAFRELCERVGQDPRRGDPLR